MSSDPYRPPTVPRRGDADGASQVRRNRIGMCGLGVSLLAFVVGVVCTARYVFDDVLHRIRSDPETGFTLFLAFVGMNLLGIFVNLLGLIWRPRRYSLVGLGLAALHLPWQFVLVLDGFGRMM